MSLILEAVLARAKEGDIIECVCVGIHKEIWRLGSKHVVRADSNGLYVKSLTGERRRYAASHIRFILHSTTVTANTLQEAQYNGTYDAALDSLSTPDTWDELATGGRVKAESNEWQPDTMDVDLTKKIREW